LFDIKTNKNKQQQNEADSAAFPAVTPQKRKNKTQKLTIIIIAYNEEKQPTNLKHIKTNEHTQKNT